MQNTKKLYKALNEQNHNKIVGTVKKRVSSIAVYDIVSNTRVSLFLILIVNSLKPFQDLPPDT
jgi:hypothetical protein